MAMQPGFATEEQLNMVKGRQDAAGQSHFPQNTHVHAEYAPDADDTVIDVLEQLKMPQQSQQQQQQQQMSQQQQQQQQMSQQQSQQSQQHMSQQQMQQLEQMQLDRPLLYPTAAASAAAATHPPSFSGQRRAWMPSARDVSLAVLVVLMSVLVGIMPIDRYLAAYAPALVASAPYAAVIARALLVAAGVVLVRRAMGEA